MKKKKEAAQIVLSYGKGKNESNVRILITSKKGENKEIWLKKGKMELGKI